MMRIVRRSDLVWKPWKNGGGVAADIVVMPEGAGWEDFDGRVSLARVEKSGVFSVFPAADRVMMILSGNGLTLDIEGRSRVVLTTASAAYTFPGDAPTIGAPVDGPIENLNVMMRRGPYRCTMVRRRGPMGLTVTGREVAVVLVERGTWQAAGERLGVGDAAIISSSIAAEGDADVIEVRLAPA